MRLEYFQLIDRIVELDLPGRKISAQATVPTESTIFEGHFPGYPLLPGVLMIEAMAQTSGWLVLAMNEFKRMAFLGAVKEAKFRSFVMPGQSLALSAALEHEGSGYAVLKARGAVDGKAVCDATITLRVMDFPAPNFRAHMLDVAGRIGLPVKEVANG